MNLNKISNIIKFGIPVITAIVSVLFGVLAVRMSHVTTLRDQGVELIELGNDVMLTNHTLIKLVRHYSVIHDPAVLHEYRSIIDDYDSLNGKLDKMKAIGLSDVELRYINELRELLNKLEEIEEKALAAINNGDEDLAMSLLFSGAYIELDHELEALTNTMIDKIRNRINTEAAQMTNEVTMGLLAIVVFFAIAMIFLWIFNSLFTRKAYWYEDILNHIPFPLSITDKNMKCAFINKSTENMLGIKLADVLGKHCGEIWKAGICNTPDCGVKCLERGKSSATFNQFGVDFKVDAAYLTDKNNNKVGHIEVFENITQMVKMQKEEIELVGKAVNAANEANRAKSTFLARMSHEIRTPMNAIIGLTELALREEMSDSAREHNQSVKQAADNLLAIVNDILDLSKIEAGSLEIVPGEYLLSSLIHDVVSITRVRMFDTRLRFLVSIDSNLPRTIIGDEIKIRQIMLNLLSNAVKYTDTGFVSFSVSGKDEYNGGFAICFDVSDSGRGIKEEDIVSLFGEFAQVDAQGNRGIEGTGLGLAITKSLVAAMGGEISVASQYGAGSTFSVVLPQKACAPDKFAAVENPQDKNVLVCI